MAGGSSPPEGGRSGERASGLPPARGLAASGLPLARGLPPAIGEAARGLPLPWPSLSFLLWMPSLAASLRVPAFRREKP